MKFSSYLKPNKGQAAPPSESEKSTENAGSSALSPPSAPLTAVATPRGSRPSSLYPTGDFRNSTLDEINDIKCDVMVNWMHQQQLEKMWSAGSINEGVILKKSRGEFTCCPPDLASVPGDLFDNIKTLNVRVSSTLLMYPPAPC